MFAFVTLRQEVISAMVATMSLIKELFAAGAHFGYSRSRNHPSAKSFVFGYKNRSAVIDLTKTIESLERAKGFVRTLGMEGKMILLVGTKEEARELVEKAAEDLGMPWITLRWLGGTLTNFAQIRSRSERLAELKNQKEKGDWSAFTKKERLLLDREVARLTRYLGGLVSLTKLPDALLVIDSAEEKIAVLEARKMKIPLVSLSGSDCDLGQVDYPVVANDANRQSIAFFLDSLTEAYRAGRSSVPPPAVLPDEEPLVAALASRE